MVLSPLPPSFFGIAMMRFSTIASMGFGANLRDALFAKVQSYSFGNIDQFSTASLVTRLTNDVNIVQLTFMMALRLLLRAPMMLAIAFVLAFSINRELSLTLARGHTPAGGGRRPHLVGRHQALCGGAGAH